MTIDWNHFTPWASLAGGILLGLASALFILVNGRILGISGILGGLLSPRVGDALWRMAFLLGLFAAPPTFMALAPAGLVPAPRIEAGPALLVVAGLLVYRLAISDKPLQFFQRQPGRPGQAGGTVRPARQNRFKGAP